MPTKIGKATVIPNPVIAIKPNGKPDWKWYVRLWPIVVGILAVTFYLGNRLESPADAQLRCDRTMQPVLWRLERLEDREQELEILRDVAEAIIKYIDFQTGAPR